MPSDIFQGDVFEFTLNNQPLEQPFGLFIAVNPISVHAGIIFHPGDVRIAWKELIASDKCFVCFLE